MSPSPSSPPDTPPRAGSGQVVILAGGTGGAKLARGMLDVVGPARLTVVANTGDDIETYGALVSPDPDLVSFWLADAIDLRGWGLRDDTFATMEGLRALGVDVWFHLGDRDLAWCIERTRLLREGHSPTAALAALNAALFSQSPARGAPPRVLPMSDEPVCTWVRTGGEWRGFQEFMIRARAAGPIEDVQFRGAEQARPSAQVLGAIADAEAIVIGPSNPLASIGPILALPGMREALAAAPAPVVAVSPIVGGEILKGPTAAFMAWAGHELSARGVAEAYAGVLDGIVCDDPPPPGGPEALRIDTAMPDPASRRRVAEQTLHFARSLAG